MRGERIHLDFDGQIGRFVGAAARRAAAQGQHIWVVGGLVRDSLLGRRTTDVDLVTVTPVTALAGLFADSAHVGPHEHPGLLTVGFDALEGFTLDLVRARAETYKRPGVLPTVRPGTLLEDLSRRDFTVNAMAAKFDQSQWLLVDPLGGHRDLRDSLLRVLHDRSFEDDPSRILRGLRLVGELGLGFEARTRELAGAALEARGLAAMSHDRLRRELRRLLSGEHVEALEAAAEIGLDCAIRGLSVDSQARRRFALVCRAGSRSEGDPGERFLAQLSALSWQASGADRASLGESLGLDRHTARRLVELPERVQALARCWRAIDSEYDRFTAVGGLEEAGRLVARSLGGPELTDFIAGRWRELSARTLGISGADLLAAGFEPGEHLGRTLAATRRARIEGRIRSRDERRFAIDFLVSENAPRAEHSRSAPGGDGDHDAGARGSDTGPDRT